MIDDANDGHIIFGDLGGLKLPDIFLTEEVNPEKTSPRKPVPTRDRTQARCVTGMHAATWPTAVDFTREYTRYFVNVAKLVTADKGTTVDGEYIEKMKFEASLIVIGPISSFTSSS